MVTYLLLNMLHAGQVQTYDSHCLATGYPGYLLPATWRPTIVVFSRILVQLFQREKKLTNIKRQLKNVGKLLIISLLFKGYFKIIGFSNILQ